MAAMQEEVPALQAQAEALQAELVQQVRANHTKELETLTRRVATLNKTIQSRDTQIIDMEQKLEDANRYLSQFCGA